MKERFQMVPLANRFSQHDYLAGGEPVKGAALRCASLRDFALDCLPVTRQALCV